MNAKRASIVSGRWLAAIAMAFVMVVCLSAGHAEEKKKPKPEPKDPFADRSIYIEVLVVETNYDGDQVVGLVHEYMKTVNRGSVNSARSSFPVLPGSNQGLEIVGQTDLDTGILRSTIQMMVESGKGRILSKPSVLVLNGMKGVMESGEEVPYLQRRFTSSGGEFLVTSHRKTGLTLTVTPTIFNERTVNPKATDEEVAKWSSYVTLEVEAKDSVLTRYSKEANLDLPIFNTRRQSTTVVVQSGKTFMMGGLLRQRDGENMHGIPVLGELPVAGRLFRKESKSKTTKELSITITPNIIMDDVELQEQINRTIDLTAQIKAEQKRLEKSVKEGASIEDKLKEKAKK
jgi:type II secretory pathway component GspD/PulD (secretin)